MKRTQEYITKGSSFRYLIGMNGTRSNYTVDVLNIFPIDRTPCVAQICLVPGLIPLATNMLEVTMGLVMRRT